MGASGSKRESTSEREESGVSTTSEVVGEDMAPWSLLYSSHLPAWQYSSVLWGFEPRLDYTSNVKARLQPWCTGGRHFSLKYDSADDILERPYFLLSIREGCFRQTTHIRLPCAYQQRLIQDKEHTGGMNYLRAAQVVGYRGGIAIIQLNCNDQRMELVVVHMKTSSVLGIYKQKLTSRHYLCDAIISPDLTSFILKPNAMYVLNFSRGTDYKNVMKVVSCKGEHCPIIKNLFEGCAVRPFIAFDPRYRSRRLAIANYVRRGRDVVCIYDIEDEEVVVESETNTYQTTHNIVFSPDGTLLSSLVLGRSVKDGLFNFPRVLIYSSDALTVLHMIRTTYLAEVPTLCPAALFPIFSETGTHLAVAWGEQGTFYQQVAGVDVYQVPIQLSLQNMCRLELRKYFDGQDVERLPLPTKLKQYLRFQPSYG